MKNVSHRRRRFFPPCNLALRPGAQGRALTIEDYYRIKSDRRCADLAERQVGGVSRCRRGSKRTTRRDRDLRGRPPMARRRRAASRTRAATWPARAGPTTTCCSTRCNAQRTSAVFIGGPRRSARASRRTRHAVQGRDRYAECDAGPTTAGRAAGVAERRRQVDRAGEGSAARPHVAESPAPISRSGTPTRFKGRTFDWMRFQPDGQDYPDARSARCGPRRRSRSPPSTAASRRRSRRSACAPANLAWHPNGTAIAFTADEDWQNEQGYEHPDIYTVTTDGKVNAAHHRRLRVELAGVFARRPVPARRAHVRHRHDHRAEAESRRLATI